MSSKSCVNADSLGTLNDLTTDLIMANNNNINNTFSYRLNECYYDATFRLLIVMGFGEKHNKYLCEFYLINFDLLYFI